jgi:hypothetical protein
MTIRERIMSVYRNRVPDRIPVGIYARYLRTGQIERKARSAGLGILDFHPPVSLIAPPWHVRAGYLSEVKNTVFKTVLSWEDGREVETRIFETPIGEISQTSVKENADGGEWIKKHYLETPADYPIMRYVVENTVFRVQEDAFSQADRDLGEDGVVLGRLDRSPYQKLIIELADPQKFFIDFHLDPRPAEELMEVIGRRLDEQFELALRSSAEVLWQPDNLSADMTPPRMFEKYVLPFYQKRGLLCRRAGKIYAVHIDGRTKALKDQIARSPIDVVESFSLPEVGGDFPAAAAKAAWPGKVFCPNFPSPLSLKSREEIEAYLERMAADFGDRTPFMLQLSEDIPPETYAVVLPILAGFMEKRSRV